MASTKDKLRAVASSAGFSLESPQTMKKNDQITIDIEPARGGESARPWAKDLRSALCEFLDEYVASNPAPIDLTLDVGPLTYNPTDS